MLFAVCPGGLNHAAGIFYFVPADHMSSKTDRSTVTLEIFQAVKKHTAADASRNSAMSQVMPMIPADGAARKKMPMMIEIMPDAKVRRGASLSARRNMLCKPESISHIPMSIIHITSIINGEITAKKPSMIKNIASMIIILRN